MELKKYLNRLGLKGPIEADLTTLKLLQKNHLIRVPFENLDIHLGSRISLSEEKLFNKIVINRRGGICYELNYLLYLSLLEIGFKAKLLGAGILGDKSCFADHLFIMVNLDDKSYLVDVGFGDNYFEPLEFNTKKEQVDNKGIFKIRENSRNNYSLLKYEYQTSSFCEQYRFTLDRRRIDNFYSRLSFFETSELSPFRKNLFCSLERESGRISLKQDKLITTNFEERVESYLEGREGFFSSLKMNFNIVVTESERELLTNFFF